MKKEKFDGITRPSNDLYRKRFDEIFKKEKTTSELLMEGYEEEKKQLRLSWYRKIVNRSDLLEKEYLKTL